ncbi:hypothetical protein ACFW16_36025 [Inquilinus sp. NPDC058860]|uniref:hypothetical protein n=1 Tax=Inquilinus sp. NPDC058860 TaxID=3346652 RepID=UPI0036C9E23F
MSIFEGWSAFCIHRLKLIVRYPPPLLPFARALILEGYSVDVVLCFIVLGPPSAADRGTN